MSSQNDGSRPAQTSTRDRRASFSPGSSLSEFLSSNRQPQSTSAFPGPIASAVNNHRRMSVSGVSGNSPPQMQPGFAMRRGSVSSISSSTSTADESAVDDNDTSGSPTSPFARRMSWGARALRDVRIPASNPRGPITPGASSPTVSRGFWLDTTTRAPTDPALQQRRQSVSALPPPATSMPTPKDNSIDPFQERMLKGELYMD
ncbi:hypothetical protein EDC01DRAFT_718976 [Geopyxis carbonaria]|nr:hypothetical protein EDC01DRAFT_718976 [Geopyxis carbonaria]